MSEILWSPSAARAVETRMARFTMRHGHAHYPALHRWSLREPTAFWSAVWTTRRHR